MLEKAKNRAAAIEGGLFICQVLEQMLYMVFSFGLPEALWKDVLVTLSPLRKIACKELPTTTRGGTENREDKQRQIAPLLRRA